MPTLTFDPSEMLLLIAMGGVPRLPTSDSVAFVVMGLVGVPIEKCPPDRTTTCTAVISRLASAKVRLPSTQTVPSAGLLTSNNRSQPWQ